MRTLLVLLVAVSLGVGCAKRTVKTAAAPEPVTAKPQQTVPPQPAAPTTKNKPAEPDDANWLTDSRFKKDRPTFDPNPTPAQPAPADGPSATGKQPWGIAPPAGGWQGPVPEGQPRN